ncbi:MAG: DUF2510 domain-containing protein [Acidimicrobiia bacterium]
MAKQAARRYPYAYAQVFDYVARAVPLAGGKYKVLAVNPANGSIEVASSMSLASWGNNISILVRSEGPQSTRVEFVVSMKFGLVDWGARNRDIRALYQAIDSVLPGGQDVELTPTPVPAVAPTAQAAPPVAPPAGWHPDPGGRHELRYWDGGAWTANVSDAGVTAIDPLS